MGSPLYRHERHLIRTFSSGKGRGYEDHPASCSRCGAARTHWLQKQGRFQRYFCDECVQHTAAWKAEAERSDDETEKT